MTDETSLSRISELALISTSELANTKLILMSMCKASGRPTEKRKQIEALIAEITGLTNQANECLRSGNIFRYELCHVDELKGIDKRNTLLTIISYYAEASQQLYEIYTCWEKAAKQFRAEACVLVGAEELINRIELEKSAAWKRWLTVSHTYEQWKEILSSKCP